MVSFICVIDGSRQRLTPAQQRDTPHSPLSSSPGLLLAVDGCVVPSLLLAFHSYMRTVRQVLGTVCEISAENVGILL